MCTHTSLHRNLLGHRQQSHKFKTVMKGEDGSVPTISPDTSSVLELRSSVDALLQRSYAKCPSALLKFLPIFKVPSLLKSATVLSMHYFSVHMQSAL